MRIFTILFFSTLVLVASACARYEKVTVLETGISEDIPYESLGVLEVKRPGRISNTAIKSALNRQLADIADERYEADAVINVEYWPDLDSTQKYPDGLVYARGQMIRYKRFQ